MDEVQYRPVLAKEENSWVTLTLKNVKPKKKGKKLSAKRADKTQGRQKASKHI